MGRDLYAFQSMAKGNWPARAFWWQYGPIMPLYYACWYVMGAGNIISTNLGLGFILLICSILTFVTLRLFVSHPVAFVAALAFWSLDITWTFNHVGAFPFLIGSIYTFWKFVQTRHTRWCYVAVLCAWAAACVKITAGFCAFGALVVSLLLDRVVFRGSGLADNRRGILSGTVGFIILVVCSYGLLYFGLTREWINECLTIGQSHRIAEPTFWTNVKNFILRYTVWEKNRMIWVGLFSAGLVATVGGLQSKKLPAIRKKELVVAVGSTILFALIMSSDYFLDGKIYRADFWSFPFLALLAGLLVEQISLMLGSTCKVGIISLGSLWVILHPLHQCYAAAQLRVPERYLDFPHGKVYVGGNISDIETIRESTKTVLRISGPQEQLLAIPYDPLYCFLAERMHATRELIFMQHSSLSIERQNQIIEELRVKNISTIIVSNRYRSTERGMGTFGQTHCQVLAKYIKDNYRAEYTFGPWGQGPEIGHAVQILRRKVSAK